MNKKIITLGGSSSQKSINKEFANYAAELMENITIESLDLNEYQIPLFSVDLEAEKGIPADVLKISEQFKATDAFVLSLAEHNGSYAAAFKNVMDWISRVDGSIWKKKPMLLLSTSPGARGGATVMATALGSFPHLGATVVESFSLPSFFDNFKNDDIVDNALKAELLMKVKSFEKAL
ncbi:MAG: NADPH-dependent FMN reductase [Flavobacteriaceae bacterium]|nr:MAG: NADPH-dependent FMN reductase [Flavobacteriaceae bacterium]